MGKKSGSNKEAAMARADEEARQKRIREGTARINEIFDGRTVGHGKLGADAVFDPNAKYYLADGSVWNPNAASTTQIKRIGPPGDATVPVAAPGANNNGITSVTRTPGSPFMQGPTMGSSGDWGLHPTGRTAGDATGAATSKTPAELFAEALASGKLYASRTRKNGFDENYYDRVRQSYLDYANPQLEDQYATTRRELTFALDRSGLLDSSVRSEKEAELQKKYDLQKQQIRDQALAHSTQARTSVEDARSNLISMLNATGDADGAAKSAIARASALTQPQQFSPLANLFADFTAGLGAQAAAERATAMSGGVYKSPYNTGLFGGGKVQVT